MFTATIIEDKTPHLRITPRQERALASTENNTLIARRANQKIVSFMASDNLLTNIKPWETFGANYTKSKTTKYHGNHTTPRKIFNRQQENNAIIKNLVDEILLNES